ncbi:enamine deaminase RidA (YjgF/YER057c/UK114 family) [Microbacterium sp. BE35]|uniref:RidA family protein n=1 Tax=Microbacterium sp. BE35 TaxID=2817773 RepID=UPI002862F7D9|nr:RidA family protein [Microbacterium sp. BE35]MDR7188244.1 enamine deaminase RidA (YjgF/YER057c/UK114 family) [Microbacterium sp. BE35]
MRGQNHTQNPSALVTPVLRTGDLIFVSGQLPRIDGELAAVGPVDEAVSQQARAAAGMSADACLDLVASAAGGRPFIVAKITGFVAILEGFKGIGGVVDGASERIFERLGDEHGRHARSAVGVAGLPHGASVEVEMVARVL